MHRERLPPNRPRQQAAKDETTVAIARRPRPDSPLVSHPAAPQESSAHSLALLPIPVSQIPVYQIPVYQNPVYQNPPTMPVSASPARASLHARMSSHSFRSHSLHGMSPRHSE